MVGRSVIAIASLILLAGGTLLQLFVILSGGVKGAPINKFWFLKADTSGITGAPPMTAWAYFNHCPITGSTTMNCNKAKAAPAFRPDMNFGTTKGVPMSLVGSKKFYYLSRTSWAFQLIAIFFSGIGLAMGLLAVCTRLGSYLSGALTFLALLFQGLTSALMTAWSIQGRNAFRQAGKAASIGKYSYGFTWAAFACFFLSTILFCVAGSVGKKEKRYSKKSRFGAFGRKRSTRSRGSFADGTENGGVKSEYS